MIRTKFIKKGKWRTIESFFNTGGMAYFRNPAGASIKVRYGIGWFGKDRQKQKLTGTSYKRLTVGKWSLTGARMQIKVSTDTEVTYDVVPAESPLGVPSIRF
ncbi:MAG: hypothetical protein HKN76_13560 [Saprospiraceae bacterium]|nr:hypothetical protein [Saprospiraceae bacterium]